jgi:hypothetical protein
MQELSNNLADLIAKIVERYPGGNPCGVVTTVAEYYGSRFGSF